MNQKEIIQLKIEIFGMHICRNQFHHDCDRAPFKLLGIDTTKDKRNLLLHGDWSGGTNPDLACADWVDYEEISLLVKPVHEISTGEIEKCLRIHGKKTGNDFSCKVESWTDTGEKKLGFEWDDGYDWGRIDLDILNFESVNFLMEKEYAVPHNPCTVAQLVEFGIYKLTK